MNSMTRIQLSTIVALLALFVGLIAIQLTNSGYLDSVDPWTHRFFTQFAESRMLYSDTVIIHNGQMQQPYLTFMRTVIYLLTQVGQIDTYTLFFYGSLVLRAVYILLTFACVLALTRHATTALICGVLLFTSPYFIFRSYMTFPENIAVLFFLGLILGFEKYRNSNKAIFLILVVVSLVGGAYFHPKSLYISGFIVAGYLLYFIVNVEFRKVEYTLLSIIVSLFITLPIFPNLTSTVSAVVIDNVGDNSIWGSFIQGDSRYLPPGVNDYIQFIGYPVIILSMLGIIRCVRDGIRRNIHLLFMLACTFTLSLGTHLHIYMPTDRMQAYLYIPLVLIASVYLTSYIKRANHISQFFLLILITMFALSTTIDNKPWFALWHGEIPMSEQINILMAENPDAILEIDGDAIFMSVLMQYPDRICVPYVLEFPWYRPPQKDSIPDCSTADYHLARSNEPITGYRILANYDAYFLFTRLDTAR